MTKRGEHLVRILFELDANASHGSATERLWAEREPRHCAPMDRWGKAIRIECGENDSAKVVSAGADGRFGTADDRIRPLELRRLPGRGGMKVPPTIAPKK